MKILKTHLSHFNLVYIWLDGTINFRPQSEPSTSTHCKRRVYPTTLSATKSQATSRSTSRSNNRPVKHANSHALTQSTSLPSSQPITQLSSSRASSQPSKHQTNSSALQPESFLPLISSEKLFSKRLRNFESKVAMIEVANQGIFQQLLKAQAELQKGVKHQEHALQHESKARKGLEKHLKNVLETANHKPQQSPQPLLALLNEVRRADQKELLAGNSVKSSYFELLVLIALPFFTLVKVWTSSVILYNIRVFYF